MRNTKQKANLRFMIYPYGKGKFVAVCLELGLIREGIDPLKLQSRITSLSRKYLENIVKNNLSDKLLNQTLPKKYLKKYEDIVKALESYKNWKKWQKAFEALVWNQKQEKGKLLTTE